MIHGLAVGDYTITAHVRLISYSGKLPESSRVELSGQGSSEMFITISPDSQWIEYTSQVHVSTGQVDVGFYLNAKGFTSMQIDDVTFMRSQ